MRDLRTYCVDTRAKEEEEQSNVVAVEDSPEKASSSKTKQQEPGLKETQEASQADSLTRELTDLVAEAQRAQGDAEVAWEKDLTTCMDTSYEQCALEESLQMANKKQKKNAWSAKAKSCPADSRRGQKNKKDVSEEEAQAGKKARPAVS